MPRVYIYTYVVSQFRRDLCAGFGFDQKKYAQILKSVLGGYCNIFFFSKIVSKALFFLAISQLKFSL